MHVYEIPAPAYNVLSSTLLLFRLEWVVLRGNLVDKVIAEDWDLLHDILANFGDVGEEEESKDTCDSAEAACGDAAVVS